MLGAVRGVLDRSLIEDFRRRRGRPPPGAPGGAPGREGVLSGLRSDHLFLLSLCCDVMCWVCFDSSPHVFVNLIVSPHSLFRCSLANLVPHLVLIIYDYLPFITPCVFLSVVRLLWFFRLHWLYYSPLVLSCQAPVLVAVFVFLYTLLCASSYRGLLPLHLPFRVSCGRAADGSASRSDVRAASPASLLLPLLRLVPPWWSNHLCGRGFCPSLTARGSTVYYLLSK